jgi:Tfp pilus assembly protein PilX
MRFAPSSAAMHTTLRRARPPRRGERGAALIVALISVVALLGIGMVTMLSVRSDTSASGSDRFQQMALYAAESGAAAGIDYLRENCRTDGTFFTSLLNTSPTGITGNGIAAGQTGNPFTNSPSTWYSVTIRNNTAETVATTDSDGIIVVRSVGYGPNQTQATIDVEILSAECRTNFCAGEFAQRNRGARNDTAALAICNEDDVDGAGWRTVDLSGS